MSKTFGGVRHPIIPKEQLSAEIAEQTKAFLKGKDEDGIRNKIKYIKPGVFGDPFQVKYSNRLRLKKEARAKDV
tara:strand:+ start:363 stop:584 length:222 start_codon:yes stop_codon:yes gene_type:complete